MNGAYTLAHVRADKIELVCDRCDRHGKLSVQKLIERYGVDTALPEIKNLIARDGGCTYVGNNSDICRAKFSRDGVLSWTRPEDMDLVRKTLG